MSKTLLRELLTLTKSDALSFLKKDNNHKKILAVRQGELKTFDSPVGLTCFYKPEIVGEDGVKRFSDERKAINKEAAPADAETLFVSVVCNTSMYCDSHRDVLIKNAGKKSIRERKGMIPHLPDHEWKMTAELGDVQSVRYEERELREIGWNDEGTAQVIVMDTILIKAWNEKAFDKYRLGRVKQHSIGLRYIHLSLAVNEPDDDYWKDEYKIWKKYIDDVINREEVEQYGYFFAVTEFMLLENSGVLFGANPLTPTLFAGEKSFTENQPPDDEGTEDQPNNKTEEPVDISAVIRGMKLFN